MPSPRKRSPRGPTRVDGLANLAKHAHTLDELAALTRACQRSLATADDATCGSAIGEVLLAALDRLTPDQRASFLFDLLALEASWLDALLKCTQIATLPDLHGDTYAPWTLPLEG